MKIERRKFARYRLPIDAVFFYSNNPSIHGCIKDISFGGTAFEYAPIGDHDIEPEISLILMGDKFPFYLPDIRCKIIYDIKISSNHRIFNGPEARRCGVEFKKPDPDIQEKITDLLRSEVIKKNSES